MPDREVKHSKTGRTNVRLPPTGTLLWPRWGRSASHRLNALELRSFSSARTRSVALNRTRMKMHYVNYNVLGGGALNFLSSRVGGNGVTRFFAQQFDGLADGS